MIDKTLWKVVSFLVITASCLVMLWVRWNYYQMSHNRRLAFVFVGMFLFMLMIFVLLLSVVVK